MTDHEQYREEVEKRWGSDAYANSDSWWRSMDVAQRQEWMAAAAELQFSWTLAAQAGEDPFADIGQSLAERHVAWLRRIPGTPAHDAGGDLAGYVNGLADMYVADERFAANYGGREHATFVRDALQHYARTHLTTSC